MKYSSINQTKLWLVLTVIFMGTGLSAFSQETEPNNTVDQANYFQVNSTLTAAIGVSGFAPGLYMVMLKTNYGISSEKLVVGKA